MATETLATARTNVRDMLDESSAWSKLQARSLRNEDTGCCLWMGPTTTAGYGYFRLDGKRWYTHILGYTLAYGPPPEGMDVGHRCHDADASCEAGVCLHRRCWEPSHLEAQTRRDNLLSGKTIVAAKAAQTHCVRGHELNEVNARERTRPSGGRQCRVCDVEYQRQKRAGR